MAEATDLNDRVDVLSGRLDTLQISDAQFDSSAKVISDWQDFYFGNFEEWPVTELAVWRDVTIPELELAIAGLEKIAEPISEPRLPAAPLGPVIKAEAIEVRGTWPLWWKVSVAGVLVLFSYQVFKRIKKVTS